METNKENFWFVFRLLLLVNVILITVIAMAHPGTKNKPSKEEPCSAAKKINADVLNSITVKLM